MRSVLGEFAKGCESRVPLYGCSAFEYIQYLHFFLESMPEGGPEELIRITVTEAYYYDSLQAKREVVTT